MSTHLVVQPVRPQTPAPKTDDIVDTLTTIVISYVVFASAGVLLIKHNTPEQGLEFSSPSRLTQ